MNKEYLVEQDDTNDSTDMMPHLSQTFDENPSAWTSFILGIVASVAWLIPIAGIPITIVGTVFGAISQKDPRDRGVGIAGLVINIVFMVFSVIQSIVLVWLYIKKKQQSK
ncbi:hypothetical protein [Candidatus Epulonipiscium viviparus]|uniref:hypothetical protein n=1 Tax=Candidatus Epulonipiscium viviparus TaxID=420336 RepID=UPI0027380DD5|nr:hypothetical protein [Candidatus Epulopiscium viviparus]